MEEISKGRALQLLNREWHRLQGVIDARKAAAWEYIEQHGEEEGPGMSTGLLLKREEIRKTRRGVITTTYTLDVKTLRECRSLEYFAMKFFREEDTSAEPPIVLPVEIERPVSLEFRSSPAPPREQTQRTKRAA